jgi:RimJ/RimL family protein N-acetyltransferase
MIGMRDINEMSLEEAVEINNWKYSEQYSIYSFDGSEEDLNELTSGSYLSVKDENKNTIGYYCYGETAQVPVGRLFGAYEDKSFLDIGLGMRPNACGNGEGLNFLLEGLEFLFNKFNSRKFRLTVADFNQRAIRVYERAGFTKSFEFERKNGDQITKFIIMLYESN